MYIKFVQKFMLFLFWSLILPLYFCDCLGIFVFTSPNFFSMPLYLLSLSDLLIYALGWSQLGTQPLSLGSLQTSFIQAMLPCNCFSWRDMTAVHSQQPKTKWQRACSFSQQPWRAPPTLRFLPGRILSTVSGTHFSITFSPDSAPPCVSSLPSCSSLPLILPVVPLLHSYHS